MAATAWRAVRRSTEVASRRRRQRSWRGRRRAASRAAARGRPSRRAQRTTRRPSGPLVVFGRRVQRRQHDDGDVQPRDERKRRTDGQRARQGGRGVQPSERGDGEATRARPADHAHASGRYAAAAARTAARCAPGALRRTRARPRSVVCGAAMLVVRLFSPAWMRAFDDGDGRLAAPRAGAPAPGGGAVLCLASAAARRSVSALAFALSATLSSLAIAPDMAKSMSSDGSSASSFADALKRPKARHPAQFLDERLARRGGRRNGVLERGWNAEWRSLCSSLRRLRLAAVVATADGGVRPTVMACAIVGVDRRDDLLGAAAHRFRHIAVHGRALGALHSAWTRYAR